MKTINFLLLSLFISSTNCYAHPPHNSFNDKIITLNKSNTGTTFLTSAISNNLTVEGLPKGSKWTIKCANSRGETCLYRLGKKNYPFLKLTVIIPQKNIKQINDITVINKDNGATLKRMKVIRENVTGSFTSDKNNNYDSIVEINNFQDLS